MKSKLFFPFLLAGSFTWWALSAHSAPSPPLHTHRFLALSTQIELMATGVDKAIAVKAFQEIEEEFDYLNRTWNPWNSSALARLNVLFNTTEWVSMAPSVLTGLARARELSVQSDHLFNPAIGQLIKLWGFHDVHQLPNQPPEHKEIQKLLKAQPRMNQIEMQGIRIRSTNPDVYVDLGGVAKGFAVERGIEILRHHGIQNGIVNAGGDLKAIGNRMGRPWRIAIKDPSDPETLIASLNVDGEESVFTSGDYERFFIHKGKRYHHIIDPRTGYPASHWHSVTVVHKDPAVADAGATALFVASPDEWPRIAQQMNIRLVFLVSTNGTLHLSHEMANRLTLKKQYPVKKVTLPPTR